MIINDGSTDNITLKILKQLKKNSKIKVVNKKNSGLSAARNTGINLSTTKYILMLDSDDWLRLDALEIFYNFLEKNKKYNYVYSNIHLADEKKGILRKNYNFFEQLFTNQIPYCIFFRKKIFDNNFRYDEKMKKGFEDWDLNIRLGARGDYGKCLNKNLFNYNVSKQGMLLKNTLNNYSQIFRYIIKKNEKTYNYSNIIKCFFVWRKKKSNYNLKLFIFYRLFLSILSNNQLNFFFKKFYKYSISNLMQEREDINFKSVEKANKILHVITSLDVGGAEKALYLLIKNTQKNIDHEVVCLKSEGFFYKKLIKLGVKVHILNMYPKRFNLFKQFEFFTLIKKIDYNILQTWLYHSDLISSFYSLFLNKKKRENIIWTIHNNNLEIFKIGFVTRFVVFLCSILSYFSPKKIVSVSKSSIKTHTKFGYNKKKFLHIPPIFENDNSIRKNRTYGDNVLVNLKKKKNVVYFGHLARWDIQKNQQFLVESFSKIKSKNFKIIMAGKNINKDNFVLINKINKLKLYKKIILLDNIENIKLFFKKIDINLLPSLGESFPLSLCEAMLNQVPSIVSDVGDNRNIVGNTGWVFDQKINKDFINKINSSLLEIKNKNLWKIRKKNCFDRIKNNFSNDLLIKKYYSIWDTDPYEA
jgi:glycosyltransferase involved in cell wall biosynthesis